MAESVFPLLPPRAYRLLDYLSTCPQGDYTPNYRARIIGEVDIAELWDEGEVQLLKKLGLIAIEDFLPAAEGGLVKITPDGLACLAEAGTLKRFSAPDDANCTDAEPESPRKANRETSAGKSSLTDFLDRAQKVSAIANELGSAFQTESEQARASGTISPSEWNRYKATFEKYWQLLWDLASEIKNPPDGSGNVATWLAEAAKNARDIRRLTSTSNSWEYWEYFPTLNQVAWELHQAIKHVRKTLDSVDPFAFLDKAKAQKCESVTTFSLLDRFPTTPTGHIGFLEWVRDEVHYAAEAKRQQLARGYSNDTLAGMVCGIKWAEASIRISQLSTLPTDIIGAVARVLQSELTVGTVERIDQPLAQVVGALRDALENRDMVKSTLKGDSPRENGEPLGKKETSPAKRRGRKKADYTTTQREAEIAADWAQARDAGTYKGDFARDKQMKVAELKRLLDRVAARKRHSE